MRTLGGPWQTCCLNGQSTRLRPAMPPNRCAPGPSTRPTPINQRRADRTGRFRCDGRCSANWPKVSHCRCGWRQRVPRRLVSRSRPIVLRLPGSPNRGPDIGRRHAHRRRQGLAPVPDRRNRNARIRPVQTGASTPVRLLCQYVLRPIPALLFPCQSSRRVEYSQRLRAAGDSQHRRVRDAGGGRFGNYSDGSLRRPQRWKSGCSMNLVGVRSFPYGKFLGDCVLIAALLA